MEIRVLGPVEVELDGRGLTLGGPKQRAVLSLLALNANVTVSHGPGVQPAQPLAGREPSSVR
jgi:DNA-binding SARP family transcriptional activator